MPLLCRLELARRVTKVDAVAAPAREHGLIRAVAQAATRHAVHSLSHPKPGPAISSWRPFPCLFEATEALVSESVDPCPVTRPHDPVRLGRMRARRTIAVRALLLALCATTPAQLSAATKNVVCEQQSDCTVPG